MPLAPDDRVVAQRLLLLGIHADDRLPVGEVRRDLVVDVAELGVPVRMPAPSVVLKAPCREKPSAFNSVATVSEATRCPWRVSSAARFRVDFTVHSSGDSGAPRWSGSTSVSNAGTSPGSASPKGFRPAPGARTRPAGSSACSSSRFPRDTVDSATPAALATMRIPPWPRTRAAAPSVRRCWRSSRCGGNSPNASTSSAFAPSDTPAPYDPTAHENRGVIDRQGPASRPASRCLRVMAKGWQRDGRQTRSADRRA